MAEPQPPEITEADLKRGIARWAARLHLPMTRAMSAALRAEIAAAQTRRLGGKPEPATELPAPKRVARAIVAAPPADR